MKNFIIAILVVFAAFTPMMADDTPTINLQGAQKTPPPQRPKAPAHVYLTVDYDGGMMTFSSTADLGDLDVTITSNTTGQTWTYSGVALDIPVLVNLPADVYSLYIETDSWTFTTNCYVVE